MATSNTLYCATIKWYNNYGPKDADGHFTEVVETSTCYAFAPSCTNLMQRIENNFGNDIKSITINPITMTESTDDLLWVDKLTPKECKKIEESNEF